MPTSYSCTVVAVIHRLTAETVDIGPVTVDTAVDNRWTSCGPKTQLVDEQQACNY
jgi:hypothetical protein